MTAVFRLGLIGAGRMGRTHLRALAGSKSVAVTAVADPAVAALDSLDGMAIARYPDATAMFAAGGLDGVIIASPTDLHADLVGEASAAGLPILCEKPCGLDSADIERVAAAVTRSGVPFQAAYWRRFVPALAELRERIEGGELGAVLLVVSAQWDGNPPAAEFRRRSGGIFVDMGVHEFDQIRWLTGQELGDIDARGVSFVQDETVGADVDSAQALTALSGGATAIVSLGRYYPDGDMARVEVFGTSGHARADFLDPRDGDRAQLEALRRQAEAFARYARGGARTGAGVDDAADAMAAAERASRAIPRLRGALARVAT